MNKATIVGMVILALLIVTTLSVVLERLERREPDVDNPVYSNPVYGYSIEYPEELAVMQYAPERVAVGSPAPGGFAPSVNAEIARRGEGRPIYDHIKDICAAEGPRVTIYCEKLERESDFVSERGARGKEVYYDLVENTAGNIRRSTFGPVFVFDLPTTGDERALSLYLYRPISVAMEEAKATAQDIAQFVTVR